MFHTVLRARTPQELAELGVGERVVLKRIIGNSLILELGELGV